MSTEGEQQPITKIPEEKIKNPKRVAQGKKLAEMSKAAKERKRANQMEEEVHTSTSTSSEGSFGLPSLTTSISVVGAVTGIVGTYIAWKSFYGEKPTSPQKTDLKTPAEKKPKSVRYNNLDADDI